MSVHDKTLTGAETVVFQRHIVKMKFQGFNMKDAFRQSLTAPDVSEHLGTANPEVKE